MAITEKTAADFIANLVQFVDDFNDANGTNYDVRQGTTLKDIVIDAPSQEFARLSTDLVYASKVPSLNYAADLDESDLDALGANFGKTRNEATFSAGVVDFIADIAPSASVIINAGVSLSTLGTSTSSPIQFQTTETVVMDVNNLPSYAFLDGLVTKYKVSVPIRASAAGVQGNVSVGTIVQMNAPVQGITRVSNPQSTLGGTDIESNESFAARIRLSLTGNNIGTADGIKALVLDDARSEDVEVAGPGDPEMLRNEFGGSVDIYVLGSDPNSITEAPVYLTSVGTVPIANVPVISVATVTGLVGGVTTNFPVGSLAVLVKDPGLLTDSARETSYITFPTLTKPDNGTPVQVTLNYDKLIQDLQVEFDKSENHIVGADLLVRKPATIIVNVFMKIAIFSGFTALDVANAVKTAISTFINSQKLGGSINSSDLIAIGEGVAGVDSIDIPTFLPSTNVVIQKNQVAQAGVITVQIGATIY